MKDFIFLQYQKFTASMYKTYEYKADGGGETTQEESHSLKNDTINN